MERTKKIAQRLAKRRAVAQASVDSAVWIASLFGATLLRYDFVVHRVNWIGVAAMVPLALETQIVCGYFAGLYRGRWRYGSFDEIAIVAKAAAFSTAVLVALDLTLRQYRAVPISSAIIAGLSALVLMAGVRYSWRLRLELRRRPSAGGTRLIVIGAGEGGAQVITAMLRDPNSPYFPIALLDDDPSKRNLRIMSVQVMGTHKDLVTIAERLKADAVLVAIPSADAALLSDVSDLADSAGLPVKVLPSVRDLFGGNVGLEDIRDIDVADLLGRHRIDTDIASIADYLTGKKVLVTGAGGSIGSELCRQISRFAPAELLMLDRNEGGLHAVQLSIEGHALLDADNLVLANIREADVITKIFLDRRPDVVFHAAALKHLTLLERHPDEAVKTNVLGTRNVLEAAKAAGVERFVNISTDKAADPISVLGYSKRIAERITAHFGHELGLPYLSVRFGNVLASSGSVLVTFQEQIRTGGPLTVTHPDVTRYFMTVDEACELVIQAGAIGRPGEALVLDMGEPVRIDDVARRLANHSPTPIRIEYTGLRPGEKLSEDLFGSGEHDVRPIHPLISHVPVDGLDPASVSEPDLSFDLGRISAERDPAQRH